VTGQEAVLAAAVLAGGLYLLAPITRAFAARIHGPPHGRGPLDSAQLEELSDHIERLQREMLETQERLDFAERMLAQQRDAERIGPGAGG
jgi:hypothetical protein